MKTKIGTYKPATSIQIGIGEVLNLEMVLRRHVMREFKARNIHPLIKPLQRLDVRDAVKALRMIQQSQLEYSHV
tara:strand:- start:611 stop:832 length:222 start_codon:yes stop_codon:yes gene_type:complete